VIKGLLQHVAALILELGQQVRVSGARMMAREAAAVAAQDRGLVHSSAP